VARFVSPLRGSLNDQRGAMARFDSPLRGSLNDRCRAARSTTGAGRRFPGR